MKKYDVVVIGAGPGGYTAAIEAGKRGLSVLAVEKGLPGGVCLNAGCIPTKALLDTVHCAHRTNRLAGKQMEGEVKPVLQAIRDSNLAAIKRMHAGIEHLIKQAGGEMARGKAEIVDKNHVRVGDEVIEFTYLVIATGSVAVEIPGMPFDGQRIISGSQALGLTRPPSSMLIVGGGYIGCEIGEAMALAGCRVTIVEMADRILPLSDEELAAEVNKGLRNKGITVMTATRVEAVEETGEHMKVKLSSGETLEVETVMVAAGRRPFLDEEGLRNAGVEYDRRGITVDEHCRTSVENIYAVGDVTGVRMLAHVAYHQAHVAVSNICGTEATARYDAIPECVFTDPEIASVGSTEAAAREDGIAVKTVKFPFVALGRAIVTGDTAGFLKLVCKDEDVIVGGQIAGRYAAELSGIASIAVNKRMSVKELAEVVFMHPTFGEIFHEATSAYTARYGH